MAARNGGIRRLFIGKEIGIILGLLILASLFFSNGFIPSYLAILFASSIRNTIAGWSGTGLAFYAVVLFFLYLEAVVLTAGYLAVRYVYRTLFDQHSTA